MNQLALTDSILEQSRWGEKRESSSYASYRSHYYQRTTLASIVRLARPVGRFSFAWGSYLEDAGKRAWPDARLAWLSMEPSGEQIDVQLALWPGVQRKRIAISSYTRHPYCGSVTADPDCFCKLSTVLSVGRAIQQQL